MLLVVQAPDAEHAARAVDIANTWRRTLKHQCKSYSAINMAALRLDAMYWLGMENAFSIEPHVNEALRASAG